MNEYVGTPEDLFAVRPDAPPGLPVDALHCAIARAEAVVLLLCNEFNGQNSDGPSLNNTHIAGALWSVEGYLAEIRAMVDHAYRTEPVQAEAAQ